MCNKRKSAPSNNILVPVIWNRQKIKDAFLIDDDTLLGSLIGEISLFVSCTIGLGDLILFKKSNLNFRLRQNRKMKGHLLSRCPYLELWYSHKDKMVLFIKESLW